MRSPEYKVDRPTIEPFNIHTLDYDEWFDTYPFVYESELSAIRTLLPRFERGLEIGSGTARFSRPFGIVDGIDPARNLSTVALTKGIEVVNAVGEALPYKSESFDLALVVTTLCFFNDIYISFREAHRVLQRNGCIMIGLVDKDSKLGRIYQENKMGNPFYSSAKFFRTIEVCEILKKSGFVNPSFAQTVFNTNLEEIREEEPVKDGWGEGAFVVIKVKKP
jgi:SAM-dependent methyltransferase